MSRKIFCERKESTGIQKGGLGSGTKSIYTKEELQMAHLIHKQ